jgi:hypothetical protein
MEEQYILCTIVLQYTTSRVLVLVVPGRHCSTVVPQYRTVQYHALYRGLTTCATGSSMSYPMCTCYMYIVLGVHSTLY